MRCIFCKKDSSSSASVEHIIPESLGNTEHLLPRGVVCDPCNNYLSRKVEKPFLESDYIQEQRFSMAIPSKKKRIPIVSGIHLQSLSEVDMHKSINDEAVSLGSKNNKEQLHLEQALTKQNKHTVVFPVARRPDGYIVSRFVGMVGIEALASRLLKVPGGIDEIIDKSELDELRAYVRFGSRTKLWPLSVRPIYPPAGVFYDGKEAYESLHEYNILITDSNEHYIVLILFGIEYALNLGGRSIDGYYKWLQQNNDASPLYIDSKN